MAHRKRKDILSHLDPHELAEVLDQLLIRHPELREEANNIASNLLSEISVEAVSEEITDLILSVGLDVLGNRAGKQPWGYVEPGQAAWEVLEEGIEGIQKEMEKRMQARQERSAEQLCQGIVIGLYDAMASKCDGALAWAADFPAEAAAQTLSNLIKRYPPNRRRAAARRIITGIGEQAQEWLEMLYRVAEKVMSSKKKVKKTR
jgi:hypothetical protein